MTPLNTLHVEAYGWNRATEHRYQQHLLAGSEAEGSLLDGEFPSLRTAGQLDGQESAVGG